MPPAKAKSSAPSRPTIRPERDFSFFNNNCIVAGIDEAGRGPLAGPVVAACVVWRTETKRPVGITDSKQVSNADRERLYRQITRKAAGWGIGVATSGEIDLINILEATRLASQRAFHACQQMLGDEWRIGGLVTDYLEIPAIGLPTLSLIKGDCKSVSVASASILAKVTRDRMMDVYHEEFPFYGWNSNKGYSTPDHYAALALHGPSSLHRTTFNGVGFFDEQPLRSATCQRLLAHLLDCPPCEEKLNVLREEVLGCCDRLPPADYELLLRDIDAREAELLSKA